MDDGNLPTPPNTPPPHLHPPPTTAFTAAVAAASAPMHTIRYSPRDLSLICTIVALLTHIHILFCKIIYKHLAALLAFVTATPAVAPHQHHVFLAYMLRQYIEYSVLMYYACLIASFAFGIWGVVGGGQGGLVVAEGGGYFRAWMVLQGRAAGRGGGGGDALV
jgi:hypothetical protein